MGPHYTTGKDLGSRYIIETALTDARCVIVLWSRNSVQSDWVRTEAEEARRRGILVPALVDDVNIPLAFRHIQAANLVGWSGGLPNAEFDVLVGAVSEVLSNAAPLEARLGLEGITEPGRASGTTEAVLGAQHVERDKDLQDAGEDQAVAKASGNAKAEPTAPEKADEERLPPRRAEIDKTAEIAAPILLLWIRRIFSRRSISVVTAALVLACIAGFARYLVTSRGQVAHSPAVGMVPGQDRKNPKDGLAYVWIQPGRFLMGCSRGDSECFSGEQPTHLVTIGEGFWMGQTEVTQAAYQQVAGVNPSNFKGAQRPVEQVTWLEASEYCAQVGLRLPTEAEWEYAARAGTAGSRYGPLNDVAWYSVNSGSATHPVAQKNPNAWGLYDMLGNVEEWTSDSVDSGQSRAYRGGSIFNVPSGVRVSVRDLAEPAFSYETVGMRCAGQFR